MPARVCKLLITGGLYQELAIRSVYAGNTRVLPGFHHVAKLYPFAAWLRPAKCQNTWLTCLLPIDCGELSLLFAHRKVAAIRVYERQRTHAGLRIHHESLSQFDTDLLWFQQFPDTSLIL